MRQKLLSVKILWVLLLLSSISMNIYAESATYTQASTSAISLSEGTAPEGALATFSTTYTKHNQLTSGNSMTYSFAGFDGCTITGITLKMRSNQSAGSGYIEIKLGNEANGYTEIGESINGKSIINRKVSTFKEWNGAYDNTGYVDIKPTVTSSLVEENEVLIVTIGATVNSLYCQSVTIEYTMPESFVKAPTLPESCNFTDSKVIEITKNNNEAIIYYTTDGTEPSANNGEQYEGPFTISETTTVKAIAVNDNGASSVAEATYTKIEATAAEVTPAGGETTETALDIEQGTEIIITPAEGNTVTYSINDAEAITITETTTITVQELGAMVLTVTSTLGNDSKTATYCYNVVEGTKIVATLTREEVNATAKTSYSKTALVNGIAGTWSGHMAVNNQYAPNMQINCVEGYHIQSPIFPGKVLSVAVTFNASTATSSARGFVVMPSEFDGTSASESTKGCLGAASYEGKDNPTATAVLTGDATSFKIYATGGAIYIAAIEVVYEKPANHVLKVGSTGWATLYLGLDAAIPAGVECYTVSAAANGVATLSPVESILPAHTGAIVKATANTSHTFVYKSTYAGKEGIENLLQGSIVDAKISENGYVLSAPEGQVGLYIAALTDGIFLNNANKAYLPASAVEANQQSNGYRFNIENTTSIEHTILNPQPSTVIYDLTGRRVEKMEKGIYIVNGKKVVIK